jgi:hypothetical protein
MEFISNLMLNAYLCKRSRAVNQKGQNGSFLVKTGRIWHKNSTKVRVSQAAE